MKTHNAANERIKRAYFAYLREAKRNSEQTIDAAAAALHQFETYTRFRDFRSFRTEQAIGFKNHLAKQLSGNTKAPLSKATLLHVLAALRAFFFCWPGSRASGRGSATQMPTISISRPRILLSPRQTARDNRTGVECLSSHAGWD
jgi:site-specific recombinase XerD